MPSSISFILIYLLASMTAMDPAALSPAPSIASPCEPSGQLDVSARVVSKSDLGAKKRIVVELKVRPHNRIPSIRIGGEVKNGAGVNPVPERVLHLTGKSIRKVRYTFDLESGREHHLTFTIRSGSGPVIRSEAYVRINLDPNLEPLEMDDVIQFRTVSVAEVAP
jgi:hypothetical protein